jgi:hypothetical protein
VNQQVDAQKHSPGRTPSPSGRNTEKWKFEKFTRRLNILSRCRWALGHNADIDALNLELRSHTDLLYQLCPEDAISAMQMMFAEERLRIAVTLETLGQLASKFAAQPPAASQQLSYSPSDGGLELLEHLTDLNLKAQVARRTSLTEAERLKLLTMDEKDFEIRTPRGASDMEWSLAMWNPKKEIVYVEFKSYKDDRGYKSKYIQEYVLKLSILFSDPRTPVRLRTLRPLGIFKNQENGYLGFVHALPDHLWRAPPTMTESDWDIRRPHKLSKALEFRNISQAPLGLRFELARTLLKSVIFLHTSGWLHKNIRPESIIFFPKDQQPLTRKQIDWLDVFLMGYKYARLHSQTEFDGDDDGGPMTGIYGDDSDVPRVQEQITLDIYQHPTKRTEPHRRYQSAYDMYSLGLVLLEIGLWEPLAKLVPSNQNAYETQRHIRDKLHPRLVGQCGETYADVVRDCLSMERQKSDTDKERQRSLALKMYANLGRCFA